MDVLSPVILNAIAHIKPPLFSMPPTAIQVLKTSQIYVARTHRFRIRLFGAGGNGAAASGVRESSNAYCLAASGGGSGGCAIKTVECNIGDEFLLTLGAAAAAGNAGISKNYNTLLSYTTSAINGASGGASTFAGPGVNLVAGGGQGGKYALTGPFNSLEQAQAAGPAQADGAPGGVATGGDINFTGASAAAITASPVSGTTFTYRTAATPGGQIYPVVVLPFMTPTDIDPATTLKIGESGAVLTSSSSNNTSSSASYSGPGPLAGGRQGSVSTSSSQATTYATYSSASNFSRVNYVGGGGGTISDLYYTYGYSGSVYTNVASHQGGNGLAIIEEF
jgi:hypothetical protein